MNLKETLKLAWENKNQIVEGFYNKYLSHDADIKAEAARRKLICETNGVCGYYDPEGKPETSAIPGKPACSKCHCNIDAKTSCMQCWCTLKDEGKEPLWDAVIEQDMANKLNEIAYQKQFEKKD